MRWFSHHLLLKMKTLGKEAEQLKKANEVEVEKNEEQDIIEQRQDYCKEAMDISEG